MRRFGYAVVHHVLSTSRSAGINFYMNVDNPEESFLYVQEALKQSVALHREQYSKHLILLVNISLCHFQRADYVKAQQVSAYTHNKVIELKGTQHTLVYFSAITAARCAEALADIAETHLVAAKNNPVTDVLQPRGSKALAPQRYVDKLRQDAVGYRAAAARIFNSPTKYYMRSQWEEYKRRSSWEDTDANHSTNRSSRSSVYDEVRLNSRRRAEFQEVRRYHDGRTASFVPR